MESIDLDDALFLLCPSFWALTLFFVNVGDAKNCFAYLFVLRCYHVPCIMHVVSSSVLKHFLIEQVSAAKIL